MFDEDAEQKQRTKDGVLLLYIAAGLFLFGWFLSTIRDKYRNSEVLFAGNIIIYIASLVVLIWGMSCYTRKPLPEADSEDTLPQNSILRILAQFILGFIWGAIMWPITMRYGFGNMVTFGIVTAMISLWLRVPAFLLGTLNGFIVIPFIFLATCHSNL